MLFTGWEVRIVKNCDRGLENAARGRRPTAAFSRPRNDVSVSVSSSNVQTGYLKSGMLLEIEKTLISSHFSVVIKSIGSSYYLFTIVHRKLTDLRLFC